MAALLIALLQASPSGLVGRGDPKGSAEGLSSQELAVVVNTADPLSIAIGRYYAAKRHIPSSHIVTVYFDPRRDDLPVSEFAALKSVADGRVGPQVQAYALTWARPYRVGCMSITSAFALGVSESYCSTGCRATALNPYFNSSNARRPYTDFRMRPAMSIAALDLERAKALIDRGASADGLAPPGIAYLGTTKDHPRNVRAAEYALATRVAAHEFNFQVIQGDQLSHLTNVMFYFTGAASVPGIDTNKFLPGAVADHLTSFGGMLTDSPQMSALRWLEAGATGSYGTVVEPCNLLGKFPDVPVLLAHYLAGETLIEAYWKSVQMPGQGLFIGEPLAAPFRVRTRSNQPTR